MNEWQISTKSKFAFPGQFCSIWALNELNDTYYNGEGDLYLVYEFKC